MNQAGAAAPDPGRRRRRRTRVPGSADARHADPAISGLKMGLPAKRALTELWSVQRPDLVHIVTEGPLGWSALQAALKLKLPVTSDFRTASTPTARTTASAG